MCETLIFQGFYVPKYLIFGLLYVRIEHKKTGCWAASFNLESKESDGHPVPFLFKTGGKLRMRLEIYAFIICRFYLGKDNKLVVKKTLVLKNVICYHHVNGTVTGGSH